MATRKKIINLLDIDVEKVYVYERFPIKFKSTKEPGWLRGHVDVVNENGSLYAYAYNLLVPQKPFKLRVIKVNDHFIFHNKCVYDAPKDWAQRQIQVYQQDLVLIEQAKNDIVARIASIQKFC